MSKEKIGVALSGGGIRALLFHLGMFKWMAENKMLSKIKQLSTVSGGSICVALIFSSNNNKWPDDETYLNVVLPSIIKKISKQNRILNKSLFKFFTNNKTRLSTLTNIMEREWGISGHLSDLSGAPEWSINCTTIETGVCFRFRSFIDSNNEKKTIMGEYHIGYADADKYRIAKAVAMSAAFPYLIGAYKIHMADFEWRRSKNNPVEYEDIHIWDGGVYDNLGLEALFNTSNAGEFKRDIDYLIVSNASVFNSQMEKTKYGFFRRVTDLKRLLDIALNQNVSLRTRMFVDFCQRTQKGMYVNIGNSPSMVLEKTKNNHPDIDVNLNELFPNGYMSDEDCKIVKEWDTTLNTPPEDEMMCIIQHGYENAKTVYACYGDIEIEE